jgi:GNAT superfamily N-acetyltransferase
MYTKQVCLSGCTREITYWEQKQEKGSFRMYSTNTDQFVGNTVDMSIYVDETHRGKGLARKMMRELFTHIQEEIGFPTVLIYIDTDASEGFWDHIGMIPNINYDTTGQMGSGYEKCIEFTKLRTWAFNF